MAIRIIDSANGEEFCFPMLPEELVYSRAGRFEQMKLLSGDVNLPTGESTGRINFSGKLPGARRSGAYISQWRAPGEVQKLWADWLENKSKLRIIVGGTPVDEYVYLEKFELKFSGGFGDCDYAISFIRAGKIEYGMQTEKPNVGTYTAQNGDTLWSISLKMLGDGSRYSELFYANYMQLITGGGLKPGMVLKIPQVQQ